MAGAEADLLTNNIFHVASEGAAVAVRRAAREMAVDNGFDSIAAEEISIAVSELAHNIVQHVGQGQISLGIIRGKDATGIQVEAIDQGQGIADPRAALTDGFSTGGSLGFGLGAVNRLMDQFDILSSGELSSGTRIRCVRWRQKPLVPPQISSLVEVGIVSRPKPGEKLSGDVCLVTDNGQACLVALIDGIGHGEYAHQASNCLRCYVEDHAREPLGRLFNEASHACRSTRGAVMSLVRIDYLAGTLEHAGVGNIETRLLSGKSSHTLITQRGVLGTDIPLVQPVRQLWNPGDILVMFSDGLRSSWNWEWFPAARLMPAQQLARELFDELVRNDDDATLLVVKYPAT